MKAFDQAFKLYAYKKYDICDISFRVTDTFVLTYRFSHDEMKQLFSGAYEKPGINIKLDCGIKIYAVVKKNIDALRLTINTHGGNINLRYEIKDFVALVDDYNFQMANPVKWDEYDPR
jgi:hypothetical protein